MNLGEKWGFRGGTPRRWGSGRLVPMFWADCEVCVLPSLIKSRYKTCFLNLPYFMRLRKRFGFEKIRKIGWIPGIWAVFSEPWCCRSGCKFLKNAENTRVIDDFYRKYFAYYR